jgi:Domain of unknown function (DUF5668)
MVITVGVLFLLHQLHGGHFYFGATWPVLLIVLGMMHLASSLAPRDGHIEPSVPTGVPPTPAAPPAPTAGTPPGSYSSQG